MAISILRSQGAKVGQVFTPVSWAEWLIMRWGVFDAWTAGASICDPTAGQGAFAFAFFNLAKRKGVPVSHEMLKRLTLIELCSEHLVIFQTRALHEYGIEFPDSNLISQDILTEPHASQYDILVGNPPWANFTELPSAYKQQIKSYFVDEGLVPDKKKVLLGSARVDIAALVLKIVLGRILKQSGQGHFYLPVSLFFGDDAHVGFRDYIANHRKFSVEEVYEFSSTKVFPGVGTSYCCASFRMDAQQQFPVRYFRESSSRWIEHSAVPLKRPTDQWRVIGQGDTATFQSSLGIELSPKQKPRQGVNTCGANSVFIFDSKPTHLPGRYLYPLATKELWRKDDAEAHKWILLPYSPQTGKPLSWSEIESIDGLGTYLLTVRNKLEARKGTLIRSAISKGLWWSLLGVGPYSFAPYKVTWEAYGRKDFKPIILRACSGRTWQANQAMHAFIPCWSEADARRIQRGLLNPDILSLLQQMNGDGKCNWAQPGKIRKILSFEKPGCHQSTLFA